MTGCGTLHQATSAFSKGWDYLTVTPEGNHSVEPPRDGGNTSEALSWFVYIGAITAFIGIMFLAFGPTKHTGLMLMVGGGGSALTGYAIEAYAQYAVIATLFGVVCYICWVVGNKSGLKLGFEQGKDYEDNLIIDNGTRPS